MARGDTAEEAHRGLGRRYAVWRRGKGGAVTLVDRKSGWICGRVVHSRQASETREAILEALKDKPVHSLSLDNGSEFAEFRELEEQIEEPRY